MTLDDRAAEIQADAQTYPRAALHLNARRRVEALPDEAVFSLRQPWPLVTHPDAHLSGLQLRANSDQRRLWRVFEGVRQVVSQHLLKLVGIGGDQHLWVWRQQQMDG